MEAWQEGFRHGFAVGCLSVSAAAMVLGLLMRMAGCGDPDKRLVSEVEKLREYRRAIEAQHYLREGDYE